MTNRGKSIQKIIQSLLYSNKKCFSTVPLKHIIEMLILKNDKLYQLQNTYTNLSVAIRVFLLISILSCNEDCNHLIINLKNILRVLYVMIIDTLRENVLRRMEALNTILQIICLTNITVSIK